MIGCSNIGPTESSVSVFVSEEYVEHRENCTYGSSANYSFEALSGCTSLCLLQLKKAIEYDQAV